ncbi:hypothetical protein B0H21DRAFT_767740 [Amylocystis lapponica]|nr:hypothetical protein B0H21DRAFT_767740 [Amylocystis lapponica]
MSSCSSRNPRIVIIGGGLGGLSFGIGLRRQLPGFDNFVIYEKAEDVGGTWRDNTYPGCGSDTPAHWYSLSTELNPGWSAIHSPQAELQAYWKKLAEKYALHDNIQCNTKVVSAAWNSERQLYDIELEDVRYGKRTSTTAQILISAVGVLLDPVFPAGLKGLGAFKGPLFHSARWDHSVELHGKRVAVVGNGASSGQFIPHLVADPTVNVVNFCRTPSWFVYRNRRQYYALEKWIFAHIPFAMRLYRNWLVVVEYSIVLFVQHMKYSIFGGRQDDAVAFIKKLAPVKYHDKLIPDYPFGCRRAVMEAGYLTALHRPNLELNWDGIEDIIENGILTKKGDITPFDVIIFGTGYVTDSHPVRISGSTGKTLQQYCADHGGPTAYLGVSVPGFPNFYFIGGPNTTTSSGSAIYTTEIQINYAMHLIAPVIAGLASSFEVTASACDAYNARLARRFQGSPLIHPHCVSWFRVGGTGKNFSIFPWPTGMYWWMLRSPKWEDYVAVGAELWERARRRTMVRRWAGVLSILLCSGWLVAKRRH